MERGRVGRKSQFNGSEETCQLEGKIVPVKEVDQDDPINWLASNVVCLFNELCLLTYGWPTN